ncbi:MAG: ArnT family glycosyltransferase [Candidatus Heimdallarchaeaceae archaeon]
MRKKVGYGDVVLKLILILAVATFLRFYQIQTSPGYDWDEPVYARISEQTLHKGYPTTIGTLKGESTEPYLYHPPFDFYLKAGWFKLTGVSGVGSARVLSGIESVITLVVIYFMVSQVSGKKVGLIASLLIATDGWLVYTNRLNLIENAMMLIGTLGIWLYIIAIRKDKKIYYVLAGVVIALAAIYKHTGMYFLLVPAINLVLTKIDYKKHLLLLGCSLLVIYLYIVSMSILFEYDYLFQSWVQIQRAFGKIPSRGMNWGIETILTTIRETYWIFAITLIAITTGIGVVFVKTIKFLSRKTSNKNPIWLSWSIASIVFLSVIALKAPHYLITTLIPLYILIAVELERLSSTYLKTGLLILVVLLNMVVWQTRFVGHSDNALLETSQYMEENVGITKKVLAEECVGSLINQPYYNIQANQGKEALKRIEPDYVVLYYSNTQEPPSNDSLFEYIALKQLEVVTQITGFKENIYILGKKEEKK